MTTEEKPFPLEVNGARGEVPLWVGNTPLAIAATMAGLAAVSTRLECKSLNDLFQRLSGVEAAATMAAIDLLTVRGDRGAAIDALKLKHFKACSDAFALALSHHFDGEQKNDQAASAAG
ncbi:MULTISPECIES: hypothetical protein [unclassified Mesorhizobium]|uniref:hypothetical protein n=1 Tax=unclassified Mesorhizobium TaxID=325217 RepID=UPI000FDA6385|nr:MULTISPECIES: hypothetical protein [unclassified Mesorhizobium]TGR58257.1 hypothetical protein EN842_01305 [bacterium M00.F.Ca.ET.199.01.1.1]TGU41635.1 hypothetical protein EN799_03510 [bacterium M00.F.Ca.ET.156.01.1.1]TGV89741.1 hypothetical protein EN792_006175 [Mesorhizobium sp. M00.F.Ca.ET.149.01.1.1]TGR32999.1 hypothetical protein EN840_01305 [Mesorhizobium sp. M8A.F.Ca.ET.197.01.1.1]TGR34645.1 hypothetical protein EN845_01305 [Mesorhizobium sp. M8A.F.Ca.ET.202.01.1.1]